jgi:hypothetical protein
LATADPASGRFGSFVGRSRIETESGGLNGKDRFRRRGESRQRDRTIDTERVGAL